MAGRPRSPDGFVVIAVTTILRAWAFARNTAVVLFACGLLAWCASGCGASGLRAQARAITVATVALEGVERGVEAYADDEMRACSDEPCIDAAEVRLAEQLAPVGVALASTRSTLLVWVEALRLALVAGEDGDVLGALMTSAGRLVVEWGELARSLADAGLVAPVLPPLVLAAGGGL